MSIGGAFRMLEGGNQSSVPTRMIWNPCVSSKVPFFAWEAWWGKVLTIEQLKKMGFSLASKCSVWRGQR